MPAMSKHLFYRSDMGVLSSCVFPELDLLQPQSLNMWSVYSTCGHLLQPAAACNLQSADLLPGC